jgi:hypothetical protein
MAKAKAVKAPVKTQKKSRAFASADTSLRITAAEFVAWQEGMGLSNADAARLLYVSANTLTTYRAAGAGPDVARQCRAIVAGIEPGDSWDHCRVLGRINEAIKAG